MTAAITTAGRCRKMLFKQNIDIKGCSRTDSGVHANKYCVSFKADTDIPCENIIMALNSYLPDDIAVLNCTDMDIDFHARYSVVKTEYVRTVQSFEVSRKGDMVYFKVSADGFLYNMVRIMVGTLLFVNEGKIKKDELKNVILSKNRKLAGKTAPPQGLYLNDVIY